MRLIDRGLEAILMDSGSTAGLAAVGAAMAGLAALGVAVAASDIGKLPVFSIPENQQPFRKIAGRGRSRTVSGSWWLQSRGRGRKFVLFAKDDKELLVRADELQEQGNPLGELIALQRARQPYILDEGVDTLTERNMVTGIPTLYDRCRVSAWQADVPLPLTERSAREVARGLLAATGHGDVPSGNMHLSAATEGQYGGQYASFGLPDVPTIDQPPVPALRFWLTGATFGPPGMPHKTIQLEMLTPKASRRAPR